MEKNTFVLHILMILSILYSIGYAMVILFDAIIKGVALDFSHTQEQEFFFIFIFTTGIAMIAIYNMYLFPELRLRQNRSILKPNASPLDVVRFISSEEEIEVLDAVINRSPRAYKFEIAKDTGLSRMKVHRIILRLSERGILDVVKDGRYSRISISEFFTT